jgi:hypothetical protein
MTSRRFPTPWTVEQIPGEFKVLDLSPVFGHLTFQ